MRDAEGNPTRLALSAHAWGEPVPKTMADAKKLAAKGARLLERYARERERDKTKSKSKSKSKAPRKRSAKGR